MKASRLHLSAIKPFAPNGNQPIPPTRKTSMTTVVSPADDDWDTALAASQGIPGQAIDTTLLRAKGPSTFSTIGFISPAGSMLTPGAVDGSDS